MFPDYNEIKKRYKNSMNHGIASNCKLWEEKKNIKNKNNTGKASTFYEKLFKLLYLSHIAAMFFFLHPTLLMSWGIKVNVELNVSLVWF